MAFKRTSSGIANQHLFHGVDLIVFVEGGSKNYTKQEVDNNLFSKHSIDVAIWSKIFEGYMPDKSIKFKAVGSKTTIKEIAVDIIDNSIATVYAAMDKEFDEVNGNLIKHKNILYTFGYSWENDAWNSDLIKDLLSKLCHVPFDDQIVEDTFNSFVKEVKIGVYADGYQFSKGRSFFPRNGHMRCVECNPKHRPSIKKAVIDTLIDDQGLKKSTLYGYGSRKAIITEKHCYGHLFGDFCRHIVHHFLTILGMGKVSSEIVRSMVMSQFNTHLPNEIKVHYRKMLSDYEP